MEFEKLIQNIYFNPKSSGLLQSKEFPSTLSISNLVSSQIVQIRRKTDKTGLEFETSIIDVDHDFVFTPHFKGTEKRVKPRNKIQLQYIPYQGNVIQKNVYINAENVLSRRIKMENVPKSPTITHLMSIHTHPTHVNSQGEKTYSFFSDTDMRSFLASKYLVMGLVTDIFWLVFKTDKVIKQVGENGELMLRRVSHEAFHGNKYLDQVVQKEIERWGMVFYRGEIGRVLERIN